MGNALSNAAKSTRFSVAITVVIVLGCVLVFNKVYSLYEKGSFHPAYILNKSRYNERNETIMYVPQIDDEIKIVQIAGQLARRIVTYPKKDDELDRGELIGIIKLGSRVDLFIPHNKIKLLVNVGDVVIGNKTIFGYLHI